MTPIEKLLDSVEWEAVPKPEGDDLDDLPCMTHKGVLRILDVELQCAVLSNGERIFYGPVMDEMIANLPDALTNLEDREPGKLQNRQSLKET